MTPNPPPASGPGASTSTPTPLAVVGLGCLFPGSTDVAGTWLTLRDGIDRITEVPATHWRPEDVFSEDRSAPDRTYGRRGGFLDPVDFRPIEFGIAPRDLEATDTAQLLGLHAAREALRDAGLLDRDQQAKRRISVLLGVTGALELVIPLGARLGHHHWWRALAESGVDRETAGEVVRRISDSMVRWQENSFPGLLGNVVAGRIANRLDLGGTNCVVDAACASSMGAVHLAAMELESGRCDAVVTGGVDTFNDIFMYTCFSKTPALSPGGHARPFDRDGDGTTLGEGVGIVILKRLEDAERDGDRILAKLLGIGSSSDGKGTAIYAPSAEGQVRCLEAAYGTAGVSPDTIELVEAHGTGTAVGDATEVRGLTEVFRRARPEGSWCQLGSVKSQIGHTKAAAGAAGLVKVILALHHKVLPPTIKVKSPLDELQPGRSPFQLSRLPRPWISRTGSPRRAGVSAFGFGGSNFHAVLEEAAPAREAPDFEGAPLLLAASGDGPEALERQLEEWRGSLDGACLATARAIAARSRESFDPAAPRRLLVVSPREELSARLPRIQQQLRDAPHEPWSLPDGAFHGVGAAPGALAFLFPGQGSQRTGMLRDLACRTPELLHSLEEAEHAYWSDESDPVPLAERIYPPDPFDDHRARRQEESLRDTRNAQPAIGAVSVGAARLLARFAVLPAMVGGHSYGELAALHVAGRLRAEDFHQLSNFRGRLMADAGGESAGSMAAVDLPLDDLDRLVVEERLDLVVANRNAPRQGVLSGRSDEIARAITVCEARGIRATRLPVSAAFHSPAISGAREPFREVLRRVRLSPGSIPVYANSSAGRYPASEEAAKELLAGQIAEPVRFLDQVEAMVGDGVRTIVEVGPGSILSSLTRAILGDRIAPSGVQVVSLDASAGRRDGMHDLAITLATIAARGHAIDLRGWDGGVVARPLPIARKGPSVAVGGANLAPGSTGELAPLPPVAPPVDLTWPATPPAVPPSAPIVAPVIEEEWRLPPRPAVVDDETWAGIERLAEDARALEAELTTSQRLLFEGIEARIRAAVGAATTRPAPTSPSPPHSHHTSPVQTSPGSERPPTPTAAAVPASSTPPEPAAPRTAEPAPPVPAPSPTARSGGGASPLTGALVAIVADRTGYPAEAIDPAMDLEADLGIDSIKRVEILSALRSERPELPSPPPELLGTLRSLTEIAAWFDEATGASLAVGGASIPPRPATRGTPAPVTPPSPETAPAAGGAALLPSLVAIVAERTGYPDEAIDPTMDLEADLGIDSIKRVEILSALRSERPELPSPPPELLGTLRSLAEIAAWFDEATDAVEPSAPAPSIAPPSSIPAATVSPPATGATLLPALVSIVADRTGYPAEAIDPTMDLEADLGIDSIKRVEILSALRNERPELPSPPPELLGTLRSLAEIAAWFGEATDAVEPSAPAPSLPAATVAPPAAGTMLLPALVAIVAERTGYPAEAIDPTMDLEADLGIDSIKRVEILSSLRTERPELPSPPPELLGTLRSLAEIAAWFGEAAGTDAPPAGTPAPANAPAPPPSVPSPMVAAPSIDAAPTSPPASGGGLLPALVTIVADRTGYPAEAIDPPMDLEADLGIDSIKRVEILSALRTERPELPSPPPELLGTLRSLAEIAAWFGEATDPVEPSAPAPSIDPAPSIPAATVSPPAMGATLLPALVEIVADRTGYPADAIDPAMDLEADLGIDSIKRVEILSALRTERPELPSPPPELLGTLRSLAEIAAWFGEATDTTAATAPSIAPSIAPSPPTAPPAIAAAPSLPPASSTREALASLAGAERSLQRRVVEAAIAPRLIEGGLPLPAAGDVLVVGDATDPILGRLVDALRSLGVPARTSPINAPLPAVAVLRLLILVPPAAAELDELWSAVARVQEGAAALRQAGRSGGARVASVSRVDGAFGLRECSGERALLGSSLSGLVKTIPHEWEGVSGRAVDLDPRIEEAPGTIGQLAAALLADGPAEVGLRAEGTVILEERDASYAELPEDPAPFERGDLVLVTGGGRGVTAECAITIAARTCATLAILGRSAPPEPEPTWIAAARDEATLKRAFFERHPGLPPREIGERVGRVLADRELADTLARIEEVGGRALYRSVDVRDGRGLAAAIADLTAAEGPVRGWVHGAGVIEDREIEQKTRDSFERVVRTKFDGAASIASMLPIDTLRAIAFFSSSTGRYGRKGQVDYAIANEALNRLACLEARRRPQCRVASIGWGPWDGGMVTPGLARLFAAEGVGLIPIAGGSIACLRELSAPPGASIWSTVLGPAPGGGRTPAPTSDPLPVAATLPLSDSRAPTPPAEAPIAPRSGSAPRPTEGETALRMTLDPRTMPVLADHAIDGRAVLPFALMLEWGAEAALHRHPGLQLEALEKWRVMKGVILPPAGSATIEVRLGDGRADGERLRVPVELVGWAEEREVLHARGTAILSPFGTPPPRPLPSPALDPHPRGVVEAYDEELFHGPTLRTITRVIGSSDEGIAALCDPAPDPRAWLPHPHRSRWVIDPLLLDAAFQLQILWSIGAAGSPCLPCFVERLERYDRPPSVEGHTVRVRIDERSEHGASSTVEILDADGEPILRLHGAECVIDPSLGRAFAAGRATRRGPGAP
jgi:acyl transferase domain-containing protein/acyl carrier protein